MTKWGGREGQHSLTSRMTSGARIPPALAETLTTPIPSDLWTTVNRLDPHSSSTYRTSVGNNSALYTYITRKPAAIANLPKRERATVITSPPLGYKREKGFAHHFWSQDVWKLT